ncbi:cysteine desulfurase [Paenibacillaceae bacterium]|nr:cysteine desulfurase [Paenibacillaceae bacterium]
MLYFDHCASTPPHEDVVRTMSEVMMRHYANPSSIHQSGTEADKLVSRSRNLLAELFKVKPQEWVFTSGGTESNNLAIWGAARAYRRRGNHLITTQIEHASVFEVFKQLENEGYRVTYLPVDSSGSVNPDELRAHLVPETILVSIMHVNNEVGTVQPIAEIGKILQQFPKTLFHVDGVQGIGKLPIDLQGWGVDLFSGSAHKVRGPKGAGWLYVRSGVELQPLLYGGTQEGGMRAGTANVPAIVAAAKAVRLAVERQGDYRERMLTLRRQLIEEIRTIPGLALTAVQEDNKEVDTAPHIVHFCYPGMKAEVIVHFLEQRGMIVSTQAACSSKTGRPSRVLTAMGYSRESAESGIRISFGEEHDEQSVLALAQVLREMAEKLQPLKGRR